MLSWLWGSKPTDAAQSINSTPSNSSVQDPAPQPAQQTTLQRPASEPEFKLLNPQSKYKLLFGGLAFFTFSLFITRRALTRRLKQSIPPFYTSSVYHRPDVSGGAEAFEALNLATLNVLSFGMMSTGAVLYGFNIDSIDDMREYVRRGFEGDGGDLSKADVQLEEEIEQWVGSVLGKKFENKLKKEKEGSAGGKVEK
ncbi:hypothetical protein FE257_000378 [Aspergillus nanangensis]|uniref:Altered inheritance of mitochondria protein 11 n=1 Tax=Aspergillus nanangensis TaxID=2582783 RepID=A0AAD4CU71_ASPNN|nr:hypothetical protein FE257_000378 [Aspergillus nanangensis]